MSILRLGAAGLQGLWLNVRFRTHAEGTRCFITVMFTSTQENILRDMRGTVIGGGEGQADKVTDIWIFSRDAQMPDGKWVVVETRG